MPVQAVMTEMSERTEHAGDLLQEAAGKGRRCRKQAGRLRVERRPARRLSEDPPRVLQATEEGLDDVFYGMPEGGRPRRQRKDMLNILIQSCPGNPLPIPLLAP